MNGRRALGALMIVTAMTAVACAPAPTGPEAINSNRPYCPFDSKVVMYGGDSLVTKWPAWVQLPTDAVPYNTSKGGVMYTADYLLDPSQGKVGTRVTRELDQCGNDVGVVVFGGGLVDLSTGVPAADIITAMDQLDEEMFARGVKTIFLTLTPVSNNSVWYPQHQAGRQAVNAWMRTPGNLHATVVDCESALESAPGSDILATKYWNYTDFFGTVDLLHPNNDGYAAIAACAQPTILEALAG